MKFWSYGGGGDTRTCGPEEEVYEVIEGELELTIDGKGEIAKSGMVAIVPANIRHSVRALTDGRLIVVDHPARPDFG